MTTSSNRLKGLLLPTTRETDTTAVAEQLFDLGYLEATDAAATPERLVDPTGIDADTPRLGELPLKAFDLEAARAPEAIAKLTEHWLPKRWLTVLREHHGDGIDELERFQPERFEVPQIGRDLLISVIESMTPMITGRSGAGKTSGVKFVIQEVFGFSYAGIAISELTFEEIGALFPRYDEGELRWILEMVLLDLFTDAEVLHWQELGREDPALKNVVQSAFGDDRIDGRELGVRLHVADRNPPGHEGYTVTKPTRPVASRCWYPESAYGFADEAYTGADVWLVAKWAGHGYGRQAAAFVDYVASELPPERRTEGGDARFLEAVLQNFLPLPGSAKVAHPASEPVAVERFLPLAEKAVGQHIRISTSDDPDAARRDTDRFLAGVCDALGVDRRHAKGGGGAAELRNLIRRAVEYDFTAQILGPPSTAKSKFLKATLKALRTEFARNGEVVPEDRYIDVGSLNKGALSGALPVHDGRETKVTQAIRSTLDLGVDQPVTLTLDDLSNGSPNQHKLVMELLNSARRTVGEHPINTMGVIATCNPAVTETGGKASHVHKMDEAVKRRLTLNFYVAEFDLEWDRWLSGQYGADADAVVGWVKALYDDPEVPAASAVVGAREAERLVKLHQAGYPLEAALPPVYDSDVDLVTAVRQRIGDLEDRLRGVENLTIDDLLADPQGILAKVGEQVDGEFVRTDAALYDEVFNTLVSAPLEKLEAAKAKADREVAESGRPRPEVDPLYQLVEAYRDRTRGFTLLEGKKSGLFANYLVDIGIDKGDIAPAANVADVD